MSNLFDEASSSYESILTRDVWMSGENTEYFALYKAQCIKTALGERFRGRILDFGCGIGLTVKPLCALFDPLRTKIYGYDVSKKSLAVAKSTVPGAFFLEDLDDTFQEYFDVVILANVLHHVLPEERILLIESVRKLMGHRGRLFVFEHNPYNLLTQWVVKRFPLDKEAKLLRLRDTLSLLKICGFVKYRSAYIVFFPKSLKVLRSIESFLSFLPVGAQYFCEAFVRDVDEPFKTNGTIREKPLK